MDAHKDRSGKEMLTETERARSELYATLGLLTERLNYAKRIDAAVDRTVRRIKVQKVRNPLGFAAGVAGVATLAGVVTWSIVSAVVRRS